MTLASPRDGFAYLSDEFILREILLHGIKYQLFVRFIRFRNAGLPPLEDPSQAGKQGKLF